MFLTSPVSTKRWPDVCLICIAPATTRGQRQPRGFTRPHNPSREGKLHPPQKQSPSCKTLENTRGLPGTRSAVRPLSRPADFQDPDEPPESPVCPLKNRNNARNCQPGLRNTLGCCPHNAESASSSQFPRKAPCLRASDTKGAFQRRQLRFTEELSRPLDGGRSGISCSC